MLNNKTLLKILSLVVAILLWGYVMSEVDPYKTVKIKDVNIIYTNEDVLEDKELAALENEDVSLTVKIKGKRSDVNAVRKTGMTAYVDVSNCEEGENTLKIQIKEPDGISIERMSQEYIQVEAEELVEDEKPLEVSFSGESEDDSKVPWVTAVEDENVSVTGAKSLVDKVEEVQGIVPIGRVTEESGRWAKVDVSAVDKNGDVVSGITVKSGDSIRAEVRLLTLKESELAVDYRNIEDGYELEKTDAASKVAILGPAEEIENIVRIEGVADMSKIDDTETHHVKVILNLPEGIYLYEQDNSMTVQVKLKKVD